jgi:hypothetical protein
MSLCFNWGPRREDILGEWMYSPTHSLTSALDGGEWSASRPGRFIPRERAPFTYWIGGWVGPRAVLDAVVKREIPGPHRESNPRTPIVQPVARRKKVGTLLPTWHRRSCCCSAGWGVFSMYRWRNTNYIIIRTLRHTSPSSTGEIWYSYVIKAPATPIPRGTRWVPDSSEDVIF